MEPCMELKANTHIWICKDSNANDTDVCRYVPVSVTSRNPQRSPLHVLTSQSCFYWHEMDLYNIRKVLLMVTIQYRCYCRCLQLFSLQPTICLTPCVFVILFSPPLLWTKLLSMLQLYSCFVRALRLLNRAVQHNSLAIIFSYTKGAPVHNFVSATSGCIWFKFIKVFSSVCCACLHECFFQFFLTLSSILFAPMISQLQLRKYKQSRAEKCAPTLFGSQTWWWVCVRWCIVG